MAKSTSSASNTQVTFNFKNGTVRGDFDGGDISRNAGVVLLRQLDDRRHYVKRIAACISEWRKGKTQYEIEDLVRMDVYMKACGYPDGNDANSLRNDPAFKIAASPNWSDLPGQSSGSRLHNNVDADSIQRMQNLLPKQYLARFKRPPKSILLNMDSTCDPVFGSQQLSFYNKFYHEYCYTHLYLLADDGFPLGGVLRAGNAGAGEGGLAMLANVVSELRAKRKKMRIEYRADSAFQHFHTFDWCEQNRVTYFIGVAPNNVLTTLTKDLVLRAHEQYVALYGEPSPLHGKTWNQNEERIRFSTNEEGRQQELFERDQRIRIYGEVQYAAASWSRKRRVIVRVDYSAEGEDIRYVVTNSETGTAKHIYENKYCKRARCEMHIKELKSQRVDRLSSPEWLPNQFKLLMHLFAYAMQIELRATLPPYERHLSTETLRVRFLNIAGQVQLGVRVSRIRWSSSHPNQLQIRCLIDRLQVVA